MNTSRYLAVLVAASALAWRCGAEPVRVAASDTVPIDLSTAIRLALEQPAARAPLHEEQASRALVGQAGRLPNPELSWLREGQQAGARTTTVQINQPIELGGKRRARVALAQGAADLAQADALAKRQAIRADVIAAYHDVLIAGHRVALAQALADVAKKTADVAGQRVAAGKISPIDETRARLATVDAATALTQATAALTIAQTKLGALIGRASTSLADDADRLPDTVPLATLLARTGDAATIRRAQGQLAARQAQANVERAARVPDVTLSVGTQKDDQAGRRQAVVGLSVPLPLFNRNEDALRAALRRVDAAGDELAAARADTAAALTAAHTRYATARQEARLLRDDVVPGARAAYEQTLKGFEYGKFSLLDVLDAQRTWFQAQSRQWDSLEAAWRAYADIERLAGAEQY